jgi:hypothetical protein
VSIETDQDERVLAPPKAFSVVKTEGYRNEDAHSIFPWKGVSALSDGASVSFDSAAWAKILVRRYRRNPQFDRDWLNGAITDFAKLYDRESLPWMQQASFDRGTFASLLGVSHIRAGAVNVLAVGDSIAVLCEGDQVVGSFPYTSPEQFEQRPQLLSTNAADNDFLDEIEPRRWNLDEYDRPALLCMTDALGQWVLAHRDEKPSPIATLRHIKSSTSFERFVPAERESGRLRRDDTTLLAYWRY